MIAIKLRARAPRGRGWSEFPGSSFAPLAVGCRRWVKNIGPGQHLIIVSSVDAFSDHHEWHVSVSLISNGMRTRPTDEQCAAALEATRMEGADEYNETATSQVRHFWKAAGN